MQAPPPASAKRSSTAMRFANTVCWAANTGKFQPLPNKQGDNQTPSGKRGGDQISPSVSAPPSNPDIPDLLDTPPSSELDLLWTNQDSTEHVHQATSYQPPVDDPFGLESIWEQDDRKDLWWGDWMTLLAN